MKIEYSCALDRELLWQGKMYVSTTHCCFYGKIFGKKTKLSIPWKNIHAIEKKSTAGLIPNAIRIFAEDQKVIHFLNFFFL